MLYLIIAVLMSSSVSVLMRWSEQHVRNNYAMFLANYLTCSLISAAFLFLSGGTLNFSAAGAPFSILLGINGGVLYLLCFVLLKYNIGKNGVMLSTVFMKLGVLVPAALAVIVFHERPSVFQIIGFIIAIAAIVIIYLEPKKSDDPVKRLDFSMLFLLVLLILGGSSESLANFYDKFGAPELKDQYILFIFLTAALISGSVVLLKRRPVCRKDICFGVMIGIPNYFSTRFLLLSLSEVPAVVTYPVYNIGAIIIVGVFGLLLFKEKMNVRKAIGFSMIAAALLLLNI